MQLFASEQQNYIAQTLERFTREQYSLAQRQKLVEKGGSFSRDHWQFFAEMGLLALPFAETDGGLDGTLADACQVMHLIGKGLLLEPWLDCVLLAGRLLAAAEPAPLREQWLARLISGEALLALAHAERGQRFDGNVSRTRVVAEGGGWRLSGSKTRVAVPAVLDAVLVTARDADGALRICLVPMSAPGIEVRDYLSIDGHRCGDLAFNEVPVELLAFADVEAALEEVFTCARAALCAEMTGCMQVLLDDTVEYVKTRKQFGQPIGRFQVLKHRLVDCYADLQQARSLMLLAADDGNLRWQANVAAAKAFISERALHVGHEAIQMHGGMGLTDELAITHYHKRLVAGAMRFGDSHRERDRFIAASPFRAPGAGSGAIDFDSLLTPELKQFRAGVREFLEQRLSADIREALRRQTCSYAEHDIASKWHALLNEQGWLAVHWPKQFGGTGWNASERFIFEYEAAVAGAPEVIPMGFRYVGPVISHFGSEWQQSFFLPKMLSGEHYWAQGFSEPGAGSDLASLRTTAVRQGDHYIVNGSKMWTTHAHYANWIFCIVRTESGARPQDGISFLLIDLNSPGITISPIPLLAADHEVNQVFFDDVKVPVSHLVGEEGRGWEYAKFLLEYERGGAVFCGRMRHEINLVKELIASGGDEFWHQPQLAHRMARLEERLMALELIEYRTAVAAQGGTAPGVVGSMTKLLGSELQKEITETGMMAAGYAGLEFETRRPLHGSAAPHFPGLDLELVATPRYLNMRVSSIYGGSSEVQREILAKQVLGLR